MNLIMPTIISFVAPFLLVTTCIIFAIGCGDDPQHPGAAPAAHQAATPVVDRAPGASAVSESGAITPRRVVVAIPPDALTAGATLEVVNTAIQYDPP